LAVVTTAGAAALSSGSAAAKKRTAAASGHVYTETNDATNNQVLIFSRGANGKLTKAGAVSTGGKGGIQLQPGCAPTCPFLDTQGELALTPDGRLLFAVNAGSNTITSFRATANGLKRVSVVSSRGKFPESLTVQGHLLYVVNANSLNVAGFRVSDSGKLSSIAGSSKKLIGSAIPGLARQIGFDNTGTVLVVSLFGNPTMGSNKDSIDTIAIKSNGKPGKETTHDSTQPYPFGFAFDPRNHLVMSQVTGLSGSPDGTTATFKIGAGGSSLKPISTAATNGFAPCWVVVTGNGRHAFVVNTGGPAPSGATVTQFNLYPTGKLTRTGVTTPQSSEFALTDEALSSSSRYLYVLSPAESGGRAPGPNGHIDEFRVGSDGSLTLIGATPSTPGPGLSGLVAR